MSITKLRSLGLLLLAGTAVTLSSCGTNTDWSYPADQDNIIVDGNLPDDISYNDFKTFYESLTSGNTVYSRAIDQILYEIAQKQIDFKTEFLNPEFLQEQIDKVLLAQVNTGTYDTNYVFDEARFVRALEAQMYTIGKKDQAKSGFVITPEMKVSDILGCDYSDYIERSIKPTIYRQALIAKYIYNERYTTIGSTYARKVKVVSITDRTDIKGSARKTIEAFIKNYIDDENATEAQRDLSNLSRIWLGTNITAADDAFIADNGLTTLKAEIETEVSLIDLDNPRLSNATFEAKYTNNYSYSVEKGKRLAIDSLSRTDLIEDGYFLRANGIASLPTSVTDRIFSTNYNLDPSSTSRDVTRTIHGHRYVAPGLVDSGSSTFDSIVHYDSGKDTYYIVEVFDVINSSALDVTSESKKDLTAEEKADIKRRAEIVAYELAAGSSIATDSLVYWFLNSNITYTNQDFYDYVYETYPDIFAED